MHELFRDERMRWTPRSGRRGGSEQVPFPGFRRHYTGAGVAIRRQNGQTRARAAPTGYTPVRREPLHFSRPHQSLSRYYRYRRPLLFLHAPPGGALRS